MDTEMIAMQMIASAGDGKALAFEALEEARNGNFEKALTLVKESEKASLEAHHAQTNLLVSQAKGDKLEVDVLLIHAQDHLMTSILAQELISEMVKMYIKMHEFETKLGGK
ncbi:MAG: PTS lactose/cellobiose transporter subunit IIA [Erysipelotrichaceae bacterium]|nr:PTS lactose/cellobiose transporter subunit IIA [Erysipelotrichaceae bacterium]